MMNIARACLLAWSVILSGCCLERIDRERFRELGLAEQIQLYKNAIHKRCVYSEKGRLLSAMGTHGAESAEAMTDLLKHPDADFPLEDAMAVVETVHFRGTDLRNHEVMNVLAEIANTSSNPRVRADAQRTFEDIKSNQLPRTSRWTHPKKPP